MTCRPIVSFIGTSTGTVEDVGDYKQIPFRVQEFHSGRKEFRVLVYFAADTQRFVELTRSMQQSSHLYITGEFSLQQNQGMNADVLC